MLTKNVSMATGILNLFKGRVCQMKAQGLGATAIAKELDIGRASVYRVLEANKDVIEIDVVI